MFYTDAFECFGSFTHYFQSLLTNFICVVILVRISKIFLMLVILIFFMTLQEMASNILLLGPMFVCLLLFISRLKMLFSMLLLVDHYTLMF